jgi:hypothetical protein
MLFRVLTLAAGLLGLASWAGCDGCNEGGFDAGVTDTSAVGGTFSLAWTLLDQSTNRQVTCDKLDPNATVFVQASRPGTGGLESFACKNMQATSIAKFDPGVYNFSYELHVAASGQTLTIATAPPQNGVTINSGQNVVLSPITFQVDATGRLELMLHTLPAGNCTGGAGITGFAISLEHAGGPGDTGCAPVVFALSGGGTYNANDCASPAVTRCINANETLTVTSLPSGPYQIHIRGKKGPLDCWANDDALRVPPQSRTLSQALNLALASQTPGCQ